VNFAKADSRPGPAWDARGILGMDLRRGVRAAALIVLAASAVAWGQAEIIEKIVVDGNVRISTQALTSQLSIKEGDPYEEEALRAEFRRLWDLNLFDNIALEVRQGEKGKIVLWHVTDKPLIADVEYKDVKAFTATQLEEKLTEQKADIKRGSPLDYTRIRKAQETIEMLLGQKGFLDAEVKVDVKEIAPGQESITFRARQGGKTKIRKIDFVGNTVFKDRQLKKMMKLTRERGLFSWAGSKDLYHPGKFDEDARIIRQAYLDRGYLDVEVKPEVVELLPGEKPAKTPEEAEKRRRKAEGAEAQAAAKAARREAQAAERKAQAEAKARAREAKGKTSKKPKEAKTHEPKVPKKWIFATVPIDEGPQYRVGTVSVEGNEVYTDAEILTRVPLQSGEIFNDSVVKNGLGRIQLDYGERGYFYVTANQVVDKTSSHQANLKIEINEDKQYRINTLEFSGNSTTRDRVLRREMKVAEEELFDLKRFRLGMRKINQLGYWQIADEASIRPRTGENKVDIVVQGKEANRNEIQVGGGVSGLDGAFFSGSYATRNFLGRGEILQTYFQVGGRLTRYSISFIEPWFLGRPYTVGFSLFKRNTDYRDFEQGGQGVSVQVGRLLGDFSRFDATYLLEDVTYTDNRNVTSRSTTSSIVPVFTYDTRNNFFRPTRGFRFQLATEYAGGALGGDNYFLKPYGSATLYLPSFRRHYMGINASAGYVYGFGGRAIPTFERFFLGGERSLRAFKSRTVSPSRSDLDLNGNGVIDTPEDSDGDGILDLNEDANGNGILDTEDLNGNGILDAGEDVNGNGGLDTEDVDGDGRLDFGEDRNGNGALDKGEDTNGDRIFGTVFPGGDKFVQFNYEYVIPIGDTFEFLTFVDAGNAFDDYQKIDLTRLRLDYGIELRFYLPVFQAPLRFIYGIIQDPEPGEKASSFQFSIGTTF
jgi:outer membrane protein insertion porin family